MAEATVVDHIKPHRGDPSLFFGAANLQSLCKWHHDGDKQRMDMGQVVRRIGVDGYPIEDE